MYEHRRKPLLSPRAFLARLFRHFTAAAGIVLVSLGMGMLGYARLEHLAWRDAFLNAAMILGGMGPVDRPVTNSGKIFAGLYALYSGLVFLIVAGLILAPVVHRILHRLHWDDKRAP